MKSISLPKDLISKYLFLVFFLTVSALAVYNHLFTAKDRTQVIPSSLANPIDETLLSSLDSIIIKNPRLEVTLNKKEGAWILTKPKKFPLQEAIAIKMTNALQNIKITKLYPDDPLNRETFRLNEGLSSLELSAGEEKQKLIFGLNNSVDKTSYIRLSGQSTIFQIEALNLDFANLVLNDLVNINLYPYAAKNLSEVYINKGSQTKWHRIGMLRAEENLWHNTYNKKLKQKKVEAYIKKLGNVRFSHLIDERAPDLEEKLGKIFRYPEFNIMFKYNNRKIRSIISKPIRYDIPSLNIQKDQFVMIKFENNSLLYLMPKKNLSFFEKYKTKELR